MSIFFLFKTNGLLTSLEHSSISSLVRQALDSHFAEADQILGEQAIEDAKYEEYEKYMLAQEAAGIEKEPVVADASCLL